MNIRACNVDEEKEACYSTSSSLVEFGTYLGTALAKDECSLEIGFPVSLETKSPLFLIILIIASEFYPLEIRSGFLKLILTPIPSSVQ